MSQSEQTTAPLHYFPMQIRFSENNLKRSSEKQVKNQVAIMGMAQKNCSNTNVKHVVIPYLFVGFIYTVNTFQREV
jgi:hypothetical protein